MMQNSEPKLLLTCILKDDSEIELAARMLSSFMPHFQGLAVAITGVSGEHSKLIQLINHFKGSYIVTSPQTHPQLYHLTEQGGYIFSNFAQARNVSFELASKLQETERFDYWAWADVDDILFSGQELKTIATKSLEMNLDCVFFTYWYSVVLDESNNIKDILIDHLRERLLRPNMFKWISRLHEVSVPIDPNYKPLQTQFDFNPKENRLCVWAHVPGNERIMSALSRNIEILKLQIQEENRKDPRTIFYLAKTYYDLNTPELDKESEAMIVNEYLAMSGWKEERSFAWEYVGNIRSRRGDHRGAIDAYHNAIKEFGNRIMPYLLLSKEYTEVGDSEQATFWLELSLRLDPPQTRTTIGNPLEIKLLAASLKYNDALRKQQLDEAIKWLKVRQELVNDKDQGMIKILEEAKMLNEAAKWVFQYAKWLKESGHVVKIPALLESLPLELGREAFAHFIANEVNEPRVWGSDEICYYASWGGEHFEGWSAKNLERGIGGSETAVIELSKRWAKMGFKVTVYCDPRENEGEHEGVIYRPWYEMNWKDTFNILILWRSPHLLDRDIKARKIFMDLHDVASQLDWNDKRMDKIDKVFLKSTFHRNMLPKLPEEKVVVVSNGI